MQGDTNNVLVVCAVYLGDCTQWTPPPQSYSHWNSYSYPSYTSGNTREPEKAANQKRNGTDLFFDFIVARQAMANDFVLFNRHLCVPLYLVHYSKQKANRGKSQIKAQVTDTAKMYNDAWSRLPPFSWNPTNSSNFILAPNRANRCRFFAQTIFDRMNTAVPVAAPASIPSAPIVDNQLLQAHLVKLRELGFTDTHANTQRLIEYGYNLDTTIEAFLTSASSEPASATAAAVPVIDRDEAMDTEQAHKKFVSDQLLSLRELGFTDDASNTLKLIEFGYNLERTIECLLTMPASSTQANLVPAAATKAKPEQDEDGDCPICTVKPSKWITLECSHKLCNGCHGKLLTHGRAWPGRP